MHCGKALQYFGSNARLTVEEIADKLGIHKQQLSEWRWSPDLRVGVIVQFADAIGVDPLAILDRAIRTPEDPEIPAWITYDHPLYPDLCRTDTPE